MIYALLRDIDSPILNSIYESKDFEENENKNIIFENKYSFSEIYKQITDLILNLDFNFYFWKKEANLTLPEYLNSFLVNFYIAKRVKGEDEKVWLDQKNIKFLDYSFTHYLDYNFMIKYQSEISELFGWKWAVSTHIWPDNQYTEEELIYSSYSNCQILRSVTISKLQDTSFKQFPVSAKLNTLTIKDSNILSFENLPNLSNVTLLNIQSSNIISFKGLSKLVKLTNLTITDNTGISSFDDFPDLPSLKSLQIDYLFTSYKFLPVLSNLKNLIISGDNTLDFESFPKFPELEELTLNHSKITSFKYFPKLPKLLDFQFDCPQITSFKDFLNFPALKSLVVKNSQISSFEYMPALPNLVEFEGGSRMTSLKYFPVLERLHQFNITYKNENNEEVVSSGDHSKFLKYLESKFKSKN